MVCTCLFKSNSHNSRESTQLVPASLKTLLLWLFWKSFLPASTNTNTISIHVSSKVVAAHWRHWDSCGEIKITKLDLILTNDNGIQVMCTSLCLISLKSKVSLEKVEALNVWELLLKRLSTVENCTLLPDLQIGLSLRVQSADHFSALGLVGQTSLLKTIKMQIIHLNFIQELLTLVSLSICRLNDLYNALEKQCNIWSLRRP